MDFNAYLLDWTMNDYTLLQQELTDAGFGFEREASSENIRVAVPVERLDDAARLIQRHLNAPYNYVDIQYPGSKLTVIIFLARRFTITSVDENEDAKRWAIAQGLPPEQADWATSF
jgi:hypothetical protein